MVECLLGALAVSPLRAQATDASIQGLVADPTGAALGSVPLDLVHQPTGRRFASTTDARGRFTFFQLPVGGPYLLRARRIGYRPAEERISSLNQGDRRLVELSLVPSPVELAPLAVGAVASDQRIDRIAGATSVDPHQIPALPIANRNYADLAALSPWAGPQLTLAGQRWTGTEYRLDGVRSRNLLRAGEYNAGPFGPPLEAIREFEVNTNVYDVIRGRQGGGEIAAVTRSGTNRWEGGTFASYRSERLGAGTDFEGRIRSAAGIARDSLNRILSILRSTYGTTPEQQPGRLPRSPMATSLFGRVDWTLSDDNLLTMRHLTSRWSTAITVMVDLFNGLNLVDSDWGAERVLPLGISSQNPMVSRVRLLRIVGFDQATRRYRYAVNERAGVLPRGGDVYQFQIGLRLDR